MIIGIGHGFMLLRGGGAAVAVIEVAASMTAGEWGGVDLTDATTVSGNVTFALVSGVVPTGLTLDAKGGLVHGVPSAAGSSVAVYSASNPAGDVEQVKVTYAISAGARLYDRVEGPAYLTVSGGGDATPNAVMADSTSMTLAVRMKTTDAGVSNTVYEARGRSTFQMFSTGTFGITLKNSANVTVGSYSVLNARAAMASGATTLVLSVDTTQAVAADRVRVWIGGVEQSLSGSTVIAQNTILDHTRFEHRMFPTAGIPADWSVEWLWFSSTLSLTSSSFPDGVDFRTVSPASAEFIFGGSLSDWNAGTNAGTGSNGSVLDSIGVASAWTLAFKDTATPRARADATGHGAFATGGRGQATIDVTTASEAAIRAALAAAKLEPSGAYVRVLAEGEIHLDAALDLDADDTTWDFRFAPGLGSWFAGSRVRVAASNCVVIGMLNISGSRRRGQTYESRDGITIGKDVTSLADVYVTRSAAMWSTDECFSTWVTGGAVLERCTIDGLLAAEALAFPREEFGAPGGAAYRTGHPKQVLIGNDTRSTTMTRSASLSGYERNFLLTPFGAASVTDFEFVGNVIGNWGLQATQISKNDAGATVQVRLENTIYLAGDISGSATMTSLQPTREMIFLDPDYINDVYFNNVALWSVGADNAITVEALDPAPVAGVSKIAQVRATTPSTTKYGSAFWSSQAGVPAASDAPRFALTEVYDAVRANVGPRLRSGGQHPIVQRVIAYGLPERLTATTLASRPFTAALDYRGANYKGAIDEFVHLGVVVTPGAGSLSVTVPSDALPPPDGGAWGSIVVQALSAADKVSKGTWEPLDKPWITSEAISSGQNRVASNGRTYQASTTGTTGATEPTHTSGSVSDGGVTWAHFSPNMLIDELRPAGHAALPSDMFASTLSPSDDSNAVTSARWDTPLILTEAAGVYSKTGLAAGTYVVRVGWQTATTTVWVESGLLWRVT